MSNDAPTTPPSAPDAEREPWQLEHIQRVADELDGGLILSPRAAWANTLRHALMHIDPAALRAAPAEPRKGSRMLQEQMVAAHELLDGLGAPRGEGTGGEYAHTVAHRISLLTAPAEPSGETVACRFEHCACHDCGRAYGDEYGFPDLVLSNDVWKRISPTGDEGGMLCPSCIVRRCSRLGIECEAMWTSGPFAVLAEPVPEPEGRDEDWKAIERGLRAAATVLAARTASRIVGQARDHVREARKALTRLRAAEKPEGAPSAGGEGT